MSHLVYLSPCVSCSRLFLCASKVANRMRDELGTLASSDPLVAVPAWLLLNSMRNEALQFAMLSTQELQNVWRKSALGALVSESQSNASHALKSESMVRLRRFESAHSLRPSVDLFREPLGVLHDICPEVMSRDTHVQASRSPYLSKPFASCVHRFRGSLSSPIR